MFDRFGEFNSIEELNAKAAELKTEGKTKELEELAQENGFDPYVAELYLAGEIPELCPDPEDAAMAKLAVEQTGLDSEGIIKDWISYIEAQCIGNEKMARAVRKKKKSLRGCLAELLVYALTHQKAVDKDILKMAERTVQNRKIDLKKEAGMEPRWLQYTKVGIMDMGTSKALIRKYYLGEE